MLQAIALSRLAALKLNPTDRVRVILDDTKKAKRGKHMPGVGTYFDPVLSAYLVGHTYVTCVLEVKGQVIPWGIALYLKEAWCLEHEHPFKKVTELAADLLMALPEFPAGVEALVLFDSYYLCRKVLDAIPPGAHCVSMLKANRNLSVSGQKRKAGAYSKNLLRRRRTTVRIKNGRGQLVRFSIAGKWVQAHSLGQVHLVASRRAKEKKVVALVTDDPSLSDREILIEYARRWAIEVFFKEAKQHLGLGEYQTRSLEGAVKHLHLSLIAFALLTHVGRKSRRATANRKKNVLSLPSVEKLQYQLRELVGHDLLQSLDTCPKKKKTTTLFKQKIQRLLLT